MKEVLVKKLITLAICWCLFLIFLFPFKTWISFLFFYQITQLIEDIQRLQASYDSLQESTSARVSKTLFLHFYVQKIYLFWIILSM